MAAFTSLTNKKPELWRSKLGTDYPKDYMEKNESRLYKELQEIRDLPGNRICADCGCKGTIWASVNLGVFLCMTCGAHHRSLGTHISKPKGATGTYWWGEDEIGFMKAHGNIRAQEVYGSNKPPNGISKEDPIAWKQFLTDKYVHRKYAPTTTKAFPTVTTPPQTLTKNFSSRISKNAKFTNMPMPSIDLIHFGEDHDTTSVNTSPSTPARSTKAAAPLVSPNQSDNFFADFGL